VEDQEEEDAGKKEKKKVIKRKIGINSIFL